MGNRAVITEGTGDSTPCIYLHWHGGRASVEAFLAVARQLQKAAPDAFKTRVERRDILHAICQDFIGSSAYALTYIEAYADNGDNGTYLINSKFEITGRKYFNYSEEVDPEKTAAIIGELTHG